MYGLSELETCMYGEVMTAFLKMCTKLNLAFAPENDEVILAFTRSCFDWVKMRGLSSSFPSLPRPLKVLPAPVSSCWIKYKPFVPP